MIIPALKRIFLFPILSIILISCSTKQKITRYLNKELKKSESSSTYNIGFELYDLKKDEVLFAHNANKYFIPASNTKLFTFYAGLKLLSDSIPSLRYVEKGDSLIFWGTGDPSFLHSELKGVHALEFLKNSKKQLYFSPVRYSGGIFGYGWSWDDYNDYYQAEINELPMFDNLLNISLKDNGNLDIRPRYFTSSLIADSTLSQNGFYVKRDLLNNIFRYSALLKPKVGYNQQIPFKVSDDLVIKLLSDTLHRQVQLVNMKLDKNAKVIYSVRTEDVLRQMMLPSDNFIAEQLLLVYADQLQCEMNTAEVIRKIKSRYLVELPDSIKWLDGSGLSRSNLFTPRSIIKLLSLIYQEVGDEKKLFSFLPAGGKIGTLKNTYPKTEVPFVYAKTGTLGGVHNQSGYLKTKKGKLLLFSFMNNNYILPTSSIRKEMVRIITAIHERF